MIDKELVAKILKQMNEMSVGAKEHRKKIESTYLYKNCVKWSKEDLAYCKVKYQYSLGEKMKEVWKLQREVKRLKDKIKGLEK